MRTPQAVRHLSERRVATVALAVYPPAMDEQPLNAGILDLATHRLCGTPYRCGVRWALTPPFHPCLVMSDMTGGCFLSLVPDVAAGFPLENAMLSVARTFLFMSMHKATDHISAAANLALFSLTYKSAMLHFYNNPIVNSV